MLKKTLTLFFLFLFALTLRSTRGAETLPPASQWVPQQAVISLEVSHPD